MSLENITCPNCKLQFDLPKDRKIHISVGVCPKCRKIFYTLMGESYILQDIDIFNISNEELKTIVLSTFERSTKEKLHRLFTGVDLRKNILMMYEKYAKEDMMEKEEFEEYDEIVEEYDDNFEYNDGYQDGYVDGAGMSYNEISGKMEDTDSFDDFDEGSENFNSPNIQEAILSKLEDMDTQPKEEPKKIPDKEVELFKSLLNGNSTVQHLMDLG